MSRRVANDFPLFSSDDRLLRRDAAANFCAIRRYFRDVSALICDMQVTRLAAPELPIGEALVDEESRAFAAAPHRQIRFMNPDQHENS